MKVFTSVDVAAAVSHRLNTSSSYDDIQKFRRVPVCIVHRTAAGPQAMSVRSSYLRSVSNVHRDYELTGTVCDDSGCEILRCLVLNICSLARNNAIKQLNMDMMALCGDRCSF